MSKNKANLSIRDLRKTNVAFLAKCSRRYGEEKQVLWRRTVNAKYRGNPAAFFPTWTNNSQGRGVWKGVLKGVDTVKDGSKLEVKDGHSIEFWTEA
ncbi:hypothetical protein BVC80_1761g49 [Macleaya cordata]|uniref:Uncharacterized protein n=1 Tax=Macleaya cordata TaxID=56857 RepID=A0A200QT94_MACCD|nr:hypothetical protein BVC80_1761g49 [Macleaya cordata]